MFAVLLPARYGMAQPKADEQEAIQQEANQLHVQVQRLFAEGKFADALPLAQRKVELWENMRGGQSAEVASCLLWVGQIQDELSQYADAEKTFQNALQIELAIFGPDSPELTGCLSGLASVAADCGKFAEAEKLYRKIIALSEKSPNRNWRNYASNLDSLGLICRNLGKYAEAEPLQRRAVEIIRQLVGVNHQDYAIAIGNLASLFYVQKRYPEALPLFQQAVAIKEKTMPDRPSLAESLSSMGAIYYDFHNFPEAERLESRALAIYEKSLPPGDFMIAKSLQNLATYYNEEEKYDQAAPLFERSVAMMEKSLPDHPYLAMTLENFAILRHRQGNDTEAVKLYDRARQLLERTLGPNHPNVAECLYNSVTLFTSENRWQEAIEIVDRQRRIVRRHVEHVLPSLTARQQLLYLILHDNSPWAFALTLGLERRQTPGAATRSAEWLLNSKAIAQETLTRTACLMQGSNDPQVAATWAKLLDVRRQLAAGFVSDGNTGADSESQETAEQLSATEKKLSQQLADATGRNFPDDPWVQLDDVRRSIPSDGVLINIARFDVFNFAGKTPAETWKAAHYAAWIVPPAEQGDVKVVDLGEATIIDDAVEEFQKAMQAAAGAGNAKSLIAELGEQCAEAEMQKALAKVAHRVWEPLAAEIGSNTQKLLLCPDGMLWLVPWEALPIEDGKYAIENYEIRLLTSGRELASVATTPRKTAPPAIFADPDYDLGHSQVETATQRVLRGAPSMNAQLRGLTAGRSATALPRVGRLKGTATEAAAIQPNLERYTGRQPIAYLDQFATEGVFKALHRPQILVLSTHGFFLPEQNSSTAKQSDSSQADPRATQAVVSNGQLVENPLLRCGLLLAGCNRSIKDRQKRGRATAFREMPTVKEMIYSVMTAC